MARQISNIDDLLMSQKTATQPATPEHQPEIEVESAEPTAEVFEVESKAAPSEVAETTTQDEYSVGDEPKPEEVLEIDDYGNQATPPKVYTEDEVNERINSAVRDRLARLERNQNQQQPTNQQVQQAAQTGFEYDADSNQSWQQQLEGFVEQTVSKMSQRQAQQAQQMKEQQIQAEHETKFRQGMSKFNDFHQVVENQPITDAMVIATRAMKDPAAFIYAAAKRAPQDLQRIAQIADPTAQMVEMGRLEERMRKAATTTKTPRPLGKTKEDMNIPHKSDKKESIEDLIARADAKRRAQLVQRRR